MLTDTRGTKFIIFFQKYDSYSPTYIVPQLPASLYFMLIDTNL